MRQKIVNAINKAEEHYEATLKEELANYATNFQKGICESRQTFITLCKKEYYVRLGPCIRERPVLLDRSIFLLFLFLPFVIPH